MSPAEEAVLGVFRARALAQNAGWPQYGEAWAATFDRLGRVGRRVRTKMGVAFERGEPTMWRVNADGTVTAYSFRNRVMTGLRLGDMRPIAKPRRPRAEDRFTSDGSDVEFHPR